ncbi:MBL fold metallo-hydrolase [Peribacillus simplex]|uniref:MBL fold metallo-hydrolase n=1 Tax=Peribacillus simplex TaxID=1478 RepID=UPI000777434E|nr:MBL fold metallo-hydrolase [Peribacillus simplex]
MTNSVRVIPIECKFGRTTAYAYYIDAPEPALIDTGIASSASQEIETVLVEHGLRIEDIRWILLTHGHVDHLGGARAIWEITKGCAEVVIPQKEAYLLRNRSAHITDYKQLQGQYLDVETQEKHTAILLNDIGEGLKPTVEVVGGDRLLLGGDVSITVVETPGHSIGSVTFVLDGVNWAFAADAVQMYGGAQSRIPTIEHPGYYRQSLQRLLEEVRPRRQETVERLFDRYFRGISTSSNISGTGLGMAIARQIVIAHDGYIEIDSKPQHGTKCNIIFPLKRVG